MSDIYRTNVANYHHYCYFGVATRDATMHILGVISFASRYSDVLHDMVYCVIANFADG